MTSTKTILTAVISGAIAFGALSAAWTAGATASFNRPPAAPTAVATVDLVAVLEGLSEKAVLEQRLEQSLADRQAQLQDIVDKIKTAQADLQTLNEGTAQYREKVRQVLELQAVAQARRDILQRIIAFEKGDMLRSIHEKIEGTVTRISERDGYDVVLLDDSGFPLPAEAADRDIERAILTRTIVYRHGSVDITSQVINQMNNEFGG
ncbi:MAG: OmpH family outer membrane protein [Phycisphaerales bacterium]